MLEVGMNVRNEKGIIGKIYGKKGGMFFYKDSNRDYITHELAHGEIIKASHNIIEILELGDLIEVECEKGNTNVFEVVAIDYENNEVGIFNNNFNIDFCSIEQIKSIVTKEQFESISYKVGEYYVC